MVMLHKNIPFRRYQRNRKIKRRMRIVKEVWQMEEKWLPIPGKYAKHHPGCSCWMCSKSFKTAYAGNKISEQRKILREKDWSDEIE